MKKLIGFFDFPTWNQLSFIKNSTSNDLNRQRFFLSFGDSLLFLLNAYKLTGQRDYVLLPEFYCPETTNFISQHLKVIFYKTNHDFSVNKQSYFEQIKRYQPRVIINYCFTGFNLSDDESAEIKKLIRPSTIIIDDCAHRWFSAKELRFINNHHFYIDSIRKNSFLLGSHLISQNNVASTAIQSMNFYKLKCQFYQFLRILLDGLTCCFKSLFFSDLSGTVFTWQNKIIGEPLQPTLGGTFSFWLYNHFDLKKIQMQRKNTILAYSKNLTRIKTPLITLPTTEAIDTGEFNYFPLLIDQTIHNDLISYLEEKNIFAESLWDFIDFKDHKNEIDSYLYDHLIILPLAHIKESDAIYVAQEIEKFLTAKKV